ncbi:MAG: ribosome maturation factor RimP [Rhodospirillales bacterium]
MNIEERLEIICRPMLDGLGFDLVQIQVTGGAKAVVQVMAERKEGRGITIDDCTQISRALSAAFDVDDPIDGAYALEVSSPGIDRPLVRADDFRRFAGHEAKVEVDPPINGQKRFRGVIKGLDDNLLTLTVEGEAVTLPFADIRKAKLVLTDALMQAGRAANEA